VASLRFGFRLSVYLPASTIEEQFAATDVIDFLKQSYPGVTHTPTDPALFRGYWLDDYDVLWVDAISIAWTDLHDATREYAEAQANAVQTQAEAIYKDSGAIQQEIYVTCEALQILQRQE
jgi:hypothetical protein